MATAETTVSGIPKITAKDIKYDETPIGRGGYGYVYRGVHKDLGTVAIKTMIADGLLPARHLRIFQSEGKKLWELKHSSIVRLLGLIMEESNYSLILEYMHFGSLTVFRSDFVDIDWSLLVSVIRDVVHGMDYLHGMDPPILHLDLKSDNILINRRIRAKITDFGLSQWKTMTRTMTRGGSTEEKGRKGTVTHVPPEVWNNINTPPNKAYDVYSFGIVLWETMVGDRPFARVSDDVIPKAVLSGQRPDMTMIPTSCPKEVVSMMTASWVQQPDKRLEFSAMTTDIDTLFEKMAPAVPDALAKLDKEIQNLYSPEDLGGDTAATANSESLFDAATKLTKPLTNLSTTSPQSVEMEDVGEEEDIPTTSDPNVPENQKQPIVGLQEEGAPGPQAAVPNPNASSSASAQPGPPQQSSQTQAKAPGAPASQTQPKTQTGAASQTPAQTGAAAQTPAQTAPAEVPFVITEEQKKALRRVLRDPVGMLLMHKDAHMCKRVFDVDLELQKKIKDSGELLKLLEQDPLLRMELQRKGPDHIGWMFNPHRMKDEIRRKRPARKPKPEAVERMRKLREERQKRENKDLPTMTSRDDPREKRSGGLSGFMNMFKKDKTKKMMKEPMSKYMDPYMDPMGGMMAMRMGMGMGGIPPDMSYKLKRALRDPKMVRYILREETPPRISPVDREVMEVMQDPDKLLYLMKEDPSLMEILVTTDKDAFMKIVARARGGPSRMRNMRDMMEMRGPRRMRMMYGGLERDMMDMDLEDEMMMMRDHDRYNRHRHDRELMDMLKKPGLPKDYPSSASKPSSTVSKPPTTTPKTTPTPTTATSTPAPAVSSATATPSSSTASGAKSPMSPKAATTSLKSASSESTSSGKAATTNISGMAKSAKASEAVKAVPMEAERPEIKSLPDDHLIKRQENIKTPVQRNTDTEPLKTQFGGLHKGFLNVDGSTSSTSESSTDPPNNVSTSQSTKSAASATAGQGQPSSSSESKKSKSDKGNKSKSSQSQGQAPGSAQRQGSTAGQGQASSSGQGQSSGQSQSGAGTGSFRGSGFGQSQQPGQDGIQIKMNPDGSVTGNFNPLDLPPGIQFGHNNTMVLNMDEDETSSSGSSGQRKRSQEYKSKWKKLSKKHRSARYGRRDEITFDHVDLIADHIGPKWIALGEEVDMKPSKLRELQIEYKMNKEQDDYDFCVRVLEDLMERKPYYTITELISSLKEINCQKIAIKLIEYIE